VWTPLGWACSDAAQRENFIDRLGIDRNGRIQQNMTKREAIVRSSRMSNTELDLRQVYLARPFIPFEKVFIPRAVGNEAFLVSRVASAPGLFITE